MRAAAPHQEGEWAPLPAQCVAAQASCAHAWPERRTLADSMAHSLLERAEQRQACRVRTGHGRLLCPAVKRAVVDGSRAHVGLHNTQPVAPCIGRGGVIVLQAGGRRVVVSLGAAQCMRQKRGGPLLLQR